MDSTKAKLTLGLLLLACVAAIPITYVKDADHNQAFSSCDPLVPEHCALPFPNNFYSVEDPRSPTGRRLTISLDTFPKDNRNRPIDPTEWNTLDGFSASATIMTYFSETPNLDNVPHHWNISRSMDADSPTMILEVNSGQIIPHWAELDMTTENTTRRAFLLQPAFRLQDATRYIVAIRHLKKQDGNAIEPSTGFLALRDKLPTDSSDIEGRRDLFEEIFEALGNKGWDRKDIQIAWDFTTASKDSVSRRLVVARDDAFTRIGRDGPSYRIVNVTDEYNANIFRRIQGLVTVPLYMKSPEPGSVLALDENGEPVYQGDVSVEFTVLIPRSLVTNPKPGRIVQYGHGLFGSQQEVQGGYLGEIANRYGYILCAADWWGMSENDLPAVIRMFSQDISDFRIIPDRTIQGIVNKLFLMKMMMGAFSKDPLVTFNGISVIDVNNRSYYGNSQGGILGGVYMAASTDVTRGCFGVPGAPYAIMLPRSVDFDPYFVIIKSRYTDAIDRIFLITSVVQMLWDRAEPGGYMNYLTSNTLPNTPAKTILFQYSLHDSQVTYLAQYVYARSVGASIFSSNVVENNEELFGFPLLADGTTHYGSVLQGYDYERPPVPSENIPPPKELDTHGYPRKEFNNQEQMDIFFRTGGIKDFCLGPCISKPPVN